MGLRLHAAGQALRRGLFQAGGIDQREVQIAKPAKAFAAVAGDARLVVDQREPAPDQTVEQRRFADIGSADNHDFWNHGAILQGRAAECAFWLSARRLRAWHRRAQCAHGLIA